MPELVELGREWRERGGRGEGGSLDLLQPGGGRPETAEELARFAREHHFDLPLVLLQGTEADVGPLAAHYGVSEGLPTTIVFDAHGALVDKEEGPGDRARFEAMLAKAVGPERP